WAASAGTNVTKWTAALARKPAMPAATISRRVTARPPAQRQAATRGAAEVPSTADRPVEWRRGPLPAEALADPPRRPRAAHRGRPVLPRLAAERPGRARGDHAAAALPRHQDAADHRAARPARRRAEHGAAPRPGPGPRLARAPGLQRRPQRAEGRGHDRE